jgi:3-oxoacyl-[acyl-carrier protein] reductase
MDRLSGKVAIVTGGSKGIGAAIAKKLASEGAAVVVNYASSQTEAGAVVSAIKEAGGRAVAIKGDVSKAEDARAIVDAAIETYGRLDILVNNAGKYEFVRLAGITEQHFHTLMNINVLGLLLVTQAAAAHMSQGGSIINIAVETITGVLAKELGAKGIRINSVNPGPTETEGSANIRRGSATDSKSDSGGGLIAHTPLGRIGQPDDIAKVALFLASDESAWITGDVIVASGGLQ